MSKSGRDEYVLDRTEFCKKDIILNQFENMIEYKKFAEYSLKNIRKKEIWKVSCLSKIKIYMDIECPYRVNYEKR